MSLQSIINISNGLDINRRKVVGIQYARNEIPRINITPTLNPWRFTVAVPNSLRYSDARTIMETIDTLDRAGPETISFSSNPKLSWIFRYQGAATTTQLNGIRVQRPGSYGQYGYLEYLVSSDQTVLGSVYTGGGAARFGQFYFRQHSSTTSRDAMVINDSGNVGIGTTAPGTALHVAGVGFIGRQNTRGSYDAADADLLISNYNSDNTSILLFNSAGAYHSSLINYYNQHLYN